MSIRAITNEELIRRNPNFLASNGSRVERKAGIDLIEKKGAQDNAKPANNANDAIDIIMRYIPSEAIALYIAAIPILPIIKEKMISIINYLGITITSSLTSFIDRWFCILVFTALTALVVLLVYIGNFQKKSKTKWTLKDGMPWWSIVSASIAFMVWAWAIPNPSVEGEITISPVSTFLLISVSILLPLIGQYIAPDFEETAAPV